jgi:hypothetical protein
MSEQLMNNVKITLVKAAQTEAGTDFQTDIIDMAGFEGVVFFGTIAVANAANYIYAQQDTAANGATMADLEGTKVVAAANGQVVWLDIYKPEKRYVRVYVERGGTDTATGDFYAIQYQGRKGLISNLVDNKLIGEIHISPAEGTE